MHTKIKQDIIDLANKNPNEEICGFLYYTVHELKIFECKNIITESEKAENFRIDHKDYLECLKLGTPCGIYHSHGDTAHFTQSDIDLSEEIMLPIYVYGIKDKNFLEYIPKSYILPLEGLPFVFGKFDCYEMIRIYFRQKYNLYMKDYDRDESYIYDERDIITENFQNEGFIKLNSIGSVKKDDVLVFSSTLARPQHFQIFLGNSRGLHHPLGRLSRVEIIRDYSKLKYILRYNKNV